MSGFLQLIGIYGVVLLVPVTGIGFAVTPDAVVLGNSEGTVQFVCQFTDEQNIKSLVVMQIKRSTDATGNSWETLAYLEPPEHTSGSLNSLPDDLQNKGLTVSASYDENNIVNTVLTLSIDRNKVQCSDARQYECSISYLEYPFETRTPSMNGTLKAVELPAITSLVRWKNGVRVQDSQGSTSTNPAEFYVGEELELECTADIGSFDYTPIKWNRVSELSSTAMIGYDPPTGTFVTVDAIRKGECGYTRSVVIKYNTTNSDANLQYNLAFECYVTISGFPYQLYTTENSPMFYAKVTGSTTESPGAATAGSGDVGVIVGGLVGFLVLIVLVVLLVYFLWYRRRSSGQDYKTKEEYGATNPNMAPAASDMYAVPDKTRKQGHENPGLDEPHETRRHHDRNGRGKPNYGMDHDADDYDSRDGSPTMSDGGIGHMGLGALGTGV